MDFVRSRTQNLKSREAAEGMNPIAAVICNYNKSKYVTECIQSVLESTFSNFDLIVVDNASTDDSVK